MATKKVSPGTKTATAQAASYEAPQVHTADDVSMEDLLAQFAAARDELLGAIEVPTWARRAISAVAAFAACATTMYFGIAVADLLTVAAVSLVGAGFIAFLTAFISSCVVWCAAFAVLPLTYDAVVNFNATKLVAAKDKALGAVSRGWTSITSKFNRNLVTV